MTDTTISRYQLISYLGNGSSSTVMKAINLDTNQTVSIKMIEKGDTTLDFVRREARIASKMSHPFIVQLYDYFEDEKKCYFVMEYIEGTSLLEVIKGCGTLSDHQIHHYMVELFLVLKYFHSSVNVVHRDLKLENILIDSNNNIKVIDFGLANEYSPSHLLSTACGSLEYTAPEVILGQAYNDSVDIWSVGIILFAMSFGFLPFTDLNFQRLMAKIASQNPIYGAANPFLIDLITRMLTKDPEQRILLEEIENHPYFNGFISIYQGVVEEWGKVKDQSKFADHLLAVYRSVKSPGIKKIKSMRGSPLTSLYSNKLRAIKHKAKKHRLSAPHLTF